MDCNLPVKRLAAALAGAAIGLSGAAVAMASGAGKEIETAAEHATFAANAGEVDKTHLHLHHVINCLEGTKGKDFDESAGDPCEGQGNGALNDLSGSSAEKQTLENALALANTAVRMKNYKPAHQTALAVKTLLTEAEAHQ